MKGARNLLSETKKFSTYSFFIWTLAVLFYFYEFFLRVLPATVASDVIDSLNVSIEQFAIIGSAYYLTYSLMQIPVGVLLDRFSARMLITVAVGLCSFGALWFSFAYGFASAFVARLFIGLGSCFGFVSLMIVTLNWFPRKYFAFLVGCGQFFGAIGPLCAGGPIALAMEEVQGDWRKIFLWVAFFGLVLTLFIGVFLRSKPITKDKILFVDIKEPFKKRITRLLKQPQVWWILAYVATVYVTIPLLGAFWGTSYLETRGFSKSTSAFVISMIWVGLAIGSPLFGRLSDLSKQRKPYLFLLAITGVISTIFMLYTPSQNPYYLGGLFLIIGLAGSGQNLSFAIMAENAPKNLKATALGVNNTALMGSAAIVPPFVTSIIRHFSVNGQLTEASFEKGFLVLPCLFSLAALVALFGIKETFCRPQSEVHKIQKS